ncbi:MAG TPA: ABC transporter permease [Acidobacteriota bacterium]|nr:ABC transporter permease [Acidobacteriota bacterium]
MSQKSANGPLSSEREFTHRTARMAWLANLGQDFRQGLRMFAKNPVFTIVTVLTLALGIGANTAMFSTMNAVLLRYIPVEEPERVVHLRTSSLPSYANQTGNTSNSFSGHTFLQLRQQSSESLSDVMGYVPLSNSGEVAVRYGAQPETAQVMMVSGNFFSGLGVAAARGRTLNAEDETKSAPVVVLSQAFWTRRFARNPSVLGETLSIKGVPFTVVGVAAGGFDGVVQNSKTDMWIPLQTRSELGPWGQQVQGAQFDYDSPNWWFLMMIGRLAPETTREQALAQLQPLYYNSVYAQTEPRENETIPQLYFESVRGMQSWTAAASHPMTLLMAMVLLVLVIACGNIIMLLLARNATRRREFGLRLALGAGRSHLFRQLLTESLLLVFAGGILGWFFASWATRLLGAWAETETGLAPDSTVLAFSFVVCIVVALAFGLIPLRAAARVPASQALRASSATSNQERKRFWGGRAMVAFQMALCLCLLVGAGLLVRTLVNLQDVDLGFQASQLLVFGIDPQRDSGTETLAFYRDLLDELRALPGVESVTVMGNRLGSGWSNNTNVFVDGVRATDPQGRSVLRWNVVGPDYFRTLGVPMLRGRDLKDADTLDAPRVLVVNRTFAETYLPGSDPLGHNVGLGGASQAFSIVGVAQDSKYSSVRESPRPMAYISYRQIPGIKKLHVELRTRSDPQALLPQVRSVVNRLDPEIPLMEPMTQEAQFEQSYSNSAVFATLALFFGVLAALLVAVGLYGTLAYRVARRTTEIGVRMALGARRDQVLWMMLRESLMVCLAGALIGLPLAYAAGQLLQSSLFGIQATDPVTFGAAALGVVIVTLLASFVPARRASSVDPLVAMRYE